MAVIRRIGVLSLARIQALILAVLGLIDGVFWAIAFARDSTGQLAQMNPLLSLGYGLIIVLPILYAILGFVFAAFITWLFNIFASRVGGVEIELVGSLPEGAAVHPARKKHR